MRSIGCALESVEWDVEVHDVFGSVACMGCFWVPRCRRTCAVSMGLPDGGRRVAGVWSAAVWIHCITFVLSKSTCVFVQIANTPSNKLPKLNTSQKIVDSFPCYSRCMCFLFGFGCSSTLLHCVSHLEPFPMTRASCDIMFLFAEAVSSKMLFPIVCLAYRRKMIGQPASTFFHCTQKIQMYCLLWRTWMNLNYQLFFLLDAFFGGNVGVATSFPLRATLK